MALIDPPARLGMPKRELSFLLAEPERRVLQYLARRMPEWLTSDHLTLLGALAAVGTAVGYAMSNRDAGWLWLASAMLVLLWFGDSLDGTLARVRKAERPRYGHYLDHLVDALATAIVGIGMGLSPYIEMDLALALVSVYLLLMVNVHLEALALDVFQLGYGRLGPTEARLILIGLNTALSIGSPATPDGWQTLRLFTNGVLVLLALAMLGALAVRAAHNLRRLALLEPR